MILFEVEGDRYHEGGELPVCETTWFGGNSGAWNYIRAHRWRIEPKPTRVVVPTDKRGMIRFLNHYAGA